MKFRFAAFLLLLLFTLPANAAPRVIEVTSRGGIKAWLLRDTRLPLLSLSFAFRGGVETDPADKQGLATLATSLLTQGAGPYDDEAFQKRLAERSISLDIGAGRDAVSGSLKTLVKNKEEAFRLLSLAITKPRFDKEAFQRMREAQVSAIRFQIGEPEWQSRYALFRLVFGNHPYAYRSLGTTQTLGNISREDAASFAQTHFAKDRLFITAVGDISPEELSVALDKIFGALPQHGAADRVPAAVLNATGASVLLLRDGKQTTIAFAAPTLRRLDPDWHAAQIANYILGGGGFVSRLMKKVRQESGLTYGISTNLAPMDKASLLIGSFATDNAKAAQALAQTKEVWRDLYENGASETEIEAAKAYLTGSLPLALTSTDGAAGILLSLKLDSMPIDYLEKRESLIRAVTKADVDRVLRQWFNPDQARFALTGTPEEIKTEEQRPLAGE